MFWGYTVFVYIYVVYKCWSKTCFYFGYWWCTTVELSSWGISTFYWSRIHRYSLSIPNIRNTFVTLSCTLFCPQNSLNLPVHGLHKVSKAFHRDAGSCWLQCFPQLCQVGWTSFGWWTILDTRGKPSNVAVLNPNQCAWHLLPYPVQRHLNILSCPFTIWMAHIQNPIVSRLKNIYFTCLLPIYTDWTLHW